MVSNEELKKSIDELTKTGRDLIKQRSEEIKKQEEARKAATERTGATTGSTKASSRRARMDEELAERFKRDAEEVNEEIDKINKNMFHQRNVFDEILKSQKKIKRLEEERAKLLEKQKKCKKDDEEWLRLQAKINQNLLDTDRARLELLQKEAEKQKEGYNRLDEFSETMDNRTKAIKKGVGEVREGVKKIGDSVSKLLGPWGKMSQAAADYAKNIGLSARGMDKLRKYTIDTVANRGIGTRYNTSVEELMALQQSYTKNVGRQVGLTTNDLETFAASSKILGNETAADFMAKFENFGLSMEDAGKRAGKMFADASKRGIAWENYSKNFLDNISLAQRYTFKNGLRGLEGMARKATEIKLDMSQAASFAESVNTVEGAVTTGAKLQVLGGPFAQMADPLGMLNESLNDMEGLQDRMIKMFGNLGSYNKNTGEVEISAFNKIRIKEAAKAAGLDANNIFEMINSNARRNEIDKALQASTASDEVKDLVKNVGTIRNGVAGVTINGEFKEASKITNADQRYLTEIARSESDDVKDIAIRLRGWDDYIQGFSKQKDAVHGQLIESMGIGKGVQKLIGDVSDMKVLLQTLAIGGMVGAGIGIGAGAFGIIKGGSHIIGGAGNLFRNSPRTVGQIGMSTRRGLGAAGRNLNVASMADGSSRIYNPTTGAHLRDVGSGIAKKGTGGLKGAIARGRANRIGWNASKFGKTTNALGWAGLGISLGTDMYVNANQNRRGKGVDYAGNMVGDALSMGAMGAQIGSIFGGAGTGIGAAIGAGAGAVNGYIKARKNQLNRNISESIGTELMGKYSIGELKEIREAATGRGSVSEKLREKMEMKGDTQILNKLDDIAKDTILPDGSVRTTVINAQKRAVGGVIGGTSRQGDKTIVAANAGEAVITPEQFNNAFNTVLPRKDDRVNMSPLRPENRPQEIRYTYDINFHGDDINVIGDGGMSTIDRQKIFDMIAVSVRNNMPAMDEQRKTGGRLQNGSSAWNNA